MAKSVPQKNQNYFLQFLFQETERSQVQPGNLTEFATKIRNEHLSRANICCIGQTDPQTREEHPLIQYPGGGTESIDAIRDGYVVLFENNNLVKQVNPNEFFRLDLPEATNSKVYYEISFKGKKGVTRGGLILPSEVIKYVLAIKDRGRPVHTALVRLILKKLGFAEREMIIHQEADPGTKPKASYPMLERLRLKPGMEHNHSHKGGPESIHQNPLFRT